MPFAGWQMPVRYQGELAEHNAVRSSCGIFDVSHMGRIVVSGSDAEAYLQGILSNDLARIREPFQSQYTLLLNEQGGIEDDLIVTNMGDQSWLLVVNAANRDKCLEKLMEAPSGVNASDQSRDSFMFALQGPEAFKVFAAHIYDASAVKRFSALQFNWNGHLLLVSRTGYTGEDGCEIIGPVNAAAEVWQTLTDDERVTPCGLAARDSLRLEACYPLHGTDIGPDTPAIGAGLGWACAKNHAGVGSQAIAEQRTNGTSKKLSRIICNTKGIPRSGCPVLLDDEIVGEVTSGTFSPTLKVGIALAWVSSDVVTPEKKVAIDVRGRSIEGVIKQDPFYSGL